MTDDYCAWVPWVNRTDLLEAVIEACCKAGLYLTVIDNSPRGVMVKRGNTAVFRPPVPFTFVQSMNYEFEETLRRGKKFCVHMHSDAVIPDGAIERLLAFAEDVDSSGRKWSVIYTHYDVLAVYNPQCYAEVGGYDITFSSYFSDNDWYVRVERAGWERINTGIEVGHVGSQTVNSDERLKFHNGMTFGLYSQYYRMKHGGEPGHETFEYPFNRPDIFKDWKP